MTAPHRIDVHHHILPPEYVSALAGIGITGSGIPFPAWSVSDTLGLSTPRKRLAAEQA